jgi:hypothetical protein
MHTGQNSIAPENSLPQLGQVRWGSMLMILTALQPAEKARSHERPETEQHGAWHICCPVARVIAPRETSALNRISEQNSCRVLGVWRLDGSRWFIEMLQSNVPRPAEKFLAVSNRPVESIHQPGHLL